VCERVCEREYVRENVGESVCEGVCDTERVKVRDIESGREQKNIRT